MRPFKVSLCALFLLLGSAAPMFGQSGREYRKTAVHNANRVFTVFGNWGVIGQPCDKGPRGAWIYQTNGYVGDVSPFVGVELNVDGALFHDVESCPVARPTRHRRESVSGTPWTFEPAAGYDNSSQEHIAMSDNPPSWPQFWPDKLNDPTDPGWRGSWNGYFGKRSSADQESYFVMDDNNDEKYNYSDNNAYHRTFKPDSRNPARNGLGLVMSVRGLQWRQWLAQDNVFWLYEITNTGTTDYSKTFFGMLCGTYNGVTGCDDSPHEYDDDWSFYDVRYNITYTGDYPKDNSRNPKWVGPVGLVGYALLETPGNPYDGIDNDDDANCPTCTPTSAPLFRSSDFDSILIRAADRVVVIDTNYVRHVVTVPDRDTTFHTRGRDVRVIPGVTKLVEGNVIKDALGNDIMNPNAYDGVDNNLNGLIDENYYLDYHQVKIGFVQATGRYEKLIDIFRPVHHKDYLSGSGTDPFSMVDEMRDDCIDNNRNWNARYDDVGRDGIPDTHDFGEYDGQPTSGYDCGRLQPTHPPHPFDTGLPGEANIDKTDVGESDQIGLTSFQYFAPAGEMDFMDDEDLWKRNSPGFFDVPPTIINNEPVSGEDGDFFYGSGYFPLLAGTTERFSLALVYGGGLPTRDQDLADLLKHKQTVQKIYDANYQFPVAPEKPALVAVPGDAEVTLYWDRKAEQTVDPVLHKVMFEGYKIYRATEPNFLDAPRITNAAGDVIGIRPIAQFDVRDSVTGYFQAGPDLFQGTSGASFYLGNDTGLQHSFVDSGVVNGKTYYYAVVAYTKGDATIGLLPVENTTRIQVDPLTGKLTPDVNATFVVPNGKAAGYKPPEGSVRLTPARAVATGDIYYLVQDPTRITGHMYQVEFSDTRDSGSFLPMTTSYSVRDLTEQSEPFIPQDTSYVRLLHKNLIAGTVTIKDPSGNIVPLTQFIVDYARGQVRSKSAGGILSGTYTIVYQYYPVSESPYILGSPYVKETKDADIFDGVELSFHNDWSVGLIDSLSGWNTGQRSYAFTFSRLDIGDLALNGIRYPADYQFMFADRIVDTSSGLYGSARVPVNFRIWNMTDSNYVTFVYNDADANGKLSSNDQIYIFDKDRSGNPVYTWFINFTTRPNQKDTVYTFTTGDILTIRTYKPFRKGDTYRFTTVRPTVDQVSAGQQLARVKVVPNPYIAASANELALPPNITSGRGLRRVDFTHIPAGAKIHIFTSRGEHVVTLEHSGSIEDGTVTWNLKSKESLDVAFGVYFYVVESSVGNKTGKLAIVK